MSLLKESNLVKNLIESKVLEVDLDLEIYPNLNSGQLPEFIILGGTTYSFYGASKVDLFKLMSAEKGVVGKIVYKQNPSSINAEKPNSIELTIIKQQTKGSLLTIGAVKSE